jgi:hypothetical protein
MTVFAGSVTDDFNHNSPGGSVESMGSNWGLYSTATTPLSSSSWGVGQASSGVNNQVRMGSISNSGLRYNNAYLPSSLLNVEVYLTYVSAPSGGATGANLWLLARIQNSGGLSAKAIGVGVGLYNSGGGPIPIAPAFAEFSNFDIARNLYSGPAAGSLSAGAGDVIGLRIFELPSGGTVYEFWTKIVAEGPTWKRKAYYTDNSPSRIVAPGRCGFMGDINITGQTVVVDNFSAQEMASIPTSPFYPDAGFLGTFLQTKEAEAKNINLPITSGYIVRKSVLLIPTPAINSLKKFSTWPLGYARAIPDRKIATYAGPARWQSIFDLEQARSAGSKDGGGVSVY